MTLADPRTILALAIFVATYAGLVLRNFRGARVPIWLVLMLGAAAMALSGSIGVQEAYDAIDLRVIVFLFGMFVLVTALDISGGLGDFARWLVRRTDDPGRALQLVFVGFALLSAFLMNDTIALMGAPVMVLLSRRLGIAAKPLLLTLAFAITTGSVATPMGNPQNALVALTSGMSDPLAQFARFLLLPTALNIAAGALLLRRLFSKEVDGIRTGEQEPPSVTVPEAGSDGGALKKRATAVVILTMAALVFVNVAPAVGLETPFGISEIAFFGAALLLAVSGQRRREIIERLDWGVLVMFASLFVLMQAVSDNGIISSVASYLPAMNPLDPREATASIVASSVVLSQVLSNVPMVALYLPIMTSLGFTGTSAYAWAALAGGSTLAGNLTLLGAASNLIVAEQAEKASVRIGFFEFMRYGAILTVVQVTILLACLVALT